jgi:hypothetical protein
MTVNNVCEELQLDSHVFQLVNSPSTMSLSHSTTTKRRSCVYLATLAHCCDPIVVCLYCLVWEHAFSDVLYNKRHKEEVRSPLLCLGSATAVLSSEMWRTWSFRNLYRQFGGSSASMFSQEYAGIRFPGKAAVIYLDIHVIFFIKWYDPITHFSAQLPLVLALRYICWI